MSIDPLTGGTEAPAGLVVFRALDGKSVFTQLDGDPRVTRGYGRYREQERPGHRTLTDFDGLDPFEMEIPVVLDGFPDRSVEGPIERLERFTSPQRKHERPAVVHVSGPVPHSSLAWRISRLDWGRSIIGRRNKRVRQHVTVVLLQTVRGEIAIDTSRQGTNARIVLVPQGVTTFGELARHFYRRRRNRPTAREIARANAMSAGARLKKGMRLRLPQ